MNGLGERNRSLELLLIEDLPSDVRLMREALKGSSVSVRINVASDGVDGMDYLLKSEMGLTVRPDLILLDLNLPKKNGSEVLAEIKSSPKLHQIPVLVMTSSDADEDIREAYNLNANCFITKPKSLDEYIHVVHAIEEFWFLTATLPNAFQAQQGSSQSCRNARGL